MRARLPAHHLLDARAFQMLDEPLSDGVALVITGFIGRLAQMLLIFIYEFPGKLPPAPAPKP